MASYVLSTDFVLLFHEMKNTWVHLPPPANVELGDYSKENLAEGQAVATIHGWIARTVQTGEAVLILAKSGFKAESPPLVRSMIEHAVGLWWIVDQRGIAIQVLARRRSERMKKLQKAQEKGWKIGGEEAQELLQNAIDVETDDATKTFDNLSHFAHQVDKYNLHDFLQPWLIETGYTHASIDSAMPYYTYVEKSLTFNLRPNGLDIGQELEASVAIITRLALDAYNRLLNTNPLEKDLENWEIRLQSLGERLVEENKLKP